MKEGADSRNASSDVGLQSQRPALQVVCLGSGGGPSEENVTGLLVRSIASNWAKNSLLAVDAGSHLAPITRILERDFPSVSEDPTVRASHESNGNGNSVTGKLARASLSPSPVPDGREVAKPEPTLLHSGPFAGLTLPNESARANALHVIRNYVNTYLITHPHLDHLSGFAINTAAFYNTIRPKVLSALPGAVNAVKQHIFNDVIWPNLTDEDGGVGFVTFLRLTEGGNVAMGEGEGRGYIEVSDGLSVKAFKVSHGVCTKGPPNHQHRGSTAGIPGLEPAQPPYHGSIVGEPVPGMARTNSQFSAPGTPGITSRPSFYESNRPSPRMNAADQQSSCVVDSTAFFIRDTETIREILIFGDVEPDVLSLSPRNYVVWEVAAHKIAHGLLGGIFIECSYDDSQPDAVLFGHLKPFHLIEELRVLAGLVHEARAARSLEKGVKKRKRSGPNGVDVVVRHALGEQDRKRSRSLAGRRQSSRDTRRSSVPDRTMTDAPVDTSPSGESLRVNTQDHIEQMHPAHIDQVSPKTARVAPQVSSNKAELPLSGIKIVVIHVKDTMKDGPHVQDNILAQLEAYEQRLQEEGKGLGCEFVISQSGESYWF